MFDVQGKKSYFYHHCNKKILYMMNGVKEKEKELYIYNDDEIIAS